MFTLNKRELRVNLDSSKLESMYLIKKHSFWYNLIISLNGHHLCGP